jgi:formylglycine-generating enzyme required for sulfatase activity
LPTYLTEVGAYGLNSDSYYGTFDQGGNVWEWNDAVISGSSRGLRGASWDNRDSLLQSFFRHNNSPTFDNVNIGFRLASVPEPSSVLMVGLAGVAFLTRRRRSTL